MFRSVPGCCRKSAAPDNGPTDPVSFRKKSCPSDPVFVFALESVRPRKREGSAPPINPPCENPTRSRNSASLSITPASVVAHLSSHAHCPVAPHREYAPSPSLRPAPLLQRLMASFGMGRAGFVVVLPDAVVLPAAVVLGDVVRNVVAVVVRPPYSPSVRLAFRPASGHAVPQKARMGRMA